MRPFMNANWKKNIVLFLSSQTISLFGSALVQYAIMWHITLTTESGVMMTIAIVCGFVPTFLLSPFAGVWADRYNRKRLIMLADSGIALSTLVMSLLFLAGYGSLWLLFVISSIRALGAAVQTPAVGAILPQLVPEDKLTKVNGTNGSLQALTMLLAPMASGALLTVASIEIIFFIDVITAVAAIVALALFLPVPNHEKAAQKQQVSYFHDMRQGVDYIAGHGYVRNFFVFSAFFFVLMAPAAFLTPLQVARSFGEEVWRLASIEMAFSIGMMAGGALIASWGGFRNKIHTMALACFMMGFCTLALGVMPVFWSYLVFMGIFGVSLPLCNTPSAVLLQEKVEKDMLGRVFGVYGMITTSMMPLGMLVFGPIADMVRIEWLLVTSGILLCVITCFLLGNKVLLKAGEPAAAGLEASEG